MEASPSDRCVLLGQGATINCLNKTRSSTTFARNIQWFKILNLSSGRLELIPSLRGERITSDAHQLRFSNTEAKDDGLYCCKAISEVRCSSSSVVNLTVSLPPVLSPLQDRTVSKGETVAINCSIAMGQPSAFSWRKNGKALPNDPKYSTIRSNNGTTLTIINVTEVDQGHYSCIVRNWKGQQGNQSLYISILLPPKPPSK